MSQHVTDTIGLDRLHSHLASAAATTPPTTADSSTRSQWLTRDAAARLAIRNHLPLAECAHFGQLRIAQALYDAVVARYSSPATAALGRLLLPYLFPELSASATVEDLVSHLRASDARYRAAVPAEDHFFSLDPTFTVDLFEQHLLTAETSALAVGAARGTPRPPFFEGCSPSPLAPSYASAAPADVSVPKDVGAASASAKRRSSKGKGGRGGGGGSSGGGGGSGSSGGGSNGGGGGGGTVDGSGGYGGGGGGSGESGGSGGSGIGGGGTGARRVGSGGGQRQQQQRRSETPYPQQLREWFLGGASGGSCPYVIRTGDRAGQTCGRLYTQHRYFFRLDHAWRAEFGDDVKLPRWADLLKSRIAIFDLTFDAIFFAMYALSISAEGDCYRCVLPDPSIAAAALGASESGTLPGTAPAEALHTFTLDSGASCCFFRDSTTLTPLPASMPVRLADPTRGPAVARSSTVLPTAALQDAMVTTTTPGSQRVSICTCTRTGRYLATFTRRPGSSLYTLATETSREAASAHVSASGKRAAPHSSFSPTTTPLQTLHIDVWGSTRVSGQSRERSFLLVVEDYTRYTTVFPLRSKGQVLDVLIPWIRTVRLQLRERFGQNLPVLRLHSDRGGEFSSNLLTEFCRGEGILQSFTLPDSPQQNGIAERRIGLVMEVARTSMIHAAPPHFLWPFAVQYAAHQLNLWPRVSLPETSPTLRWTREVGDASMFRGPASSGVSQVDPLPGPAPVQVAVGSGAARGAASGGAEPGGAEFEGAETGGAELGRVGTGGAEPQGAASSGGSAGASPKLSSQQLREWFVRRARLRSGATGAGGAGAGGAGVAAGASGAGGAAATGPGGPGAGGAGAAGAGVGGTGARGTRAIDPCAGGARGTVRPRPYFVPLLQQVLGTPFSTSLPPPLLCPPPDQSQPPLQPASPLPAPSSYTEQSGGLTERREPASRPVSPLRTTRRAPRSRPSPVPGTHTMALHPSFESAAASALVVELLDFAAACRLDYATTLVVESASASPPSVGGECALGTNVFEDRQDFECLAAAVPRFASLLLAPEGDPDAPDIPTPRSYAEAITQRQGVDYFQTFSPTPKMTTFRMLLHVAAQRDYELHSLDFSTAFLQGSLYEEIWLRRPPGFTMTFSAGTQWSLRRPVYGLRQAPREWHDTLRTTLPALRFAFFTADPSLFLRTDTSLPPFYILMYVDDLVFATADTEALTLVKSKL
ncbi:unnamed protein product [Closterium sp. NIES-54]